MLTMQSSWLSRPNLADDSPKMTHLPRIVDVVRIIERFTPIVEERRRGPTKPLQLASPVAQCDTLYKSSSRITKLRRHPVVYDVDDDFLDRRAHRSDRSRSDYCNGNFGYIASSQRSERRPNSPVPSFNGGKPSHGARLSKALSTSQSTSRQRSHGTNCTIQIHLCKFEGQVLAPAHKEQRNQVFYATIGAVIIMFRVPSSAIRTTS